MRKKRLAGFALLTFLACAVGVAGAQSPKRSPLDIAIREAEMELRQGNVEEGLSLFEKVFQENKGSAKVAQLYGRHLLEHDRVARAVEVYQQAIRETDGSAILVQELERIYRQLDRDKDALDLCLDHLEKHPDDTRWVAGELESLIRMEELADEGLSRLGKIQRAHPDEVALADLYLESLFFAGRTVPAMEFASKLDEQRKTGGSTLYQLALLAERKGSPEEALQVIDRALLSNPQAPLHTELLYDRARILRKLRRVDETLAAYDAVVSADPQNELADRALYDKAQLLQNELHRYADAHAVYETLLDRVTPIRTAEDLTTANEVQLEMANCDLQLGRLDEAAELFSRMAEQATDPAVRVEAVFQVAEMLFYQGRMQEAETKYYELVDAYPTASWVNDALDRILQIGENADEGGVPLAALAQAELQRRLGNVEKAIALIDDALASFPNSSTQDDLLLRKASFQLAKGDVTAARATADTLATRFPDSRLAPRCYLELAEHHLSSPDGERAAKEICTEILLRWPTSIEAPVARSTIDRLEGRSRDSSERIGANDIPDLG